MLNKVKALFQNLTLITILWCLLTCNAVAKEPQTVREKRVERIGDIIQFTILSTAYLTTFLLNDKTGRNQFYKSFFTILGITYFFKV